MIRSVEEEQPKGIWVGDMKDGDVGVIIAWSTGATYSGRIIQRYKDSLRVGSNPASANSQEDALLADLE